MGWIEVKKGPLEYTVVTPLEMEQMYISCETRWRGRCSCRKYPGEWCGAELRVVRKHNKGRAR